VKAPVEVFTLTVPPPVEITGALYDNVRPAGSVNDIDPVIAPSTLVGLPDVAEPATGVPASHAPGTVIVFVAVFTPLDAMIVNVSVLDPVAACR
jgi:hypothetical protein